jgi:Tol biopolymer transport system component
MRLVRRLVCGSALVLLAAFATASIGGTAPPACDLTQLQLRDSTVNQGLGSYDRLVRGKETLVKMYFSLPACHDNNDSVQITAGTLSATGGGTTLASGIVGTPTPVSTYPSAATYSAAPLNDAPADVKFVVPGANLAPPTTTDSYVASFSATITIRTKTSGTAPLSAPIERPFSSFATKTVERRTNALRILIVPMGNAANSYATEFPAAAVAAVENGMQTLSRMFPVPGGVGTLGGTTGGIRYAIDSTLLNVTTPFCGSGVNFNAIKAELAQFLVSWNAANPGAQADRVVGAVSSHNSLGSASGCAEGMAAFLSPQAWVRAFPDDAASPSMTGALFAMELGHTFGLTPSPRGVASHSLNTSADGTSPNRGYNVATRSFLADDRTAMKFTSGAWNNNTTILEKEDYAFLLCALGGQVTTECTTSSVAGTLGGVGAIDAAFAATGTTDNTPDGTHVEESFASTELEGLGTAPSSDYTLVQRAGGGGVERSDRVRVAFAESNHDDDSTHGAVGVGSFAFVVPLDIDAATFELRKAGLAAPLWSTQRTGAPTIESVEGTGGGFVEENFTNSGEVDDSQPSLTADGEWLAWRRGGDIWIQRTDGTGEPVSVPRPGTGAVEDRIVFSSNRDGNFEIYFMDTAGGSVQRLTNDAAIDRDPELSNDGSTIVFIRNDDVWLMDSDGTNARALTTNGDVESDPTISNSGNRVAFVRDVTSVGQEIMVVDADGSNEIQLTDNFVGDQKPTFSPDGGTIAFTSQATEQWRIHTVNAFGDGGPTVLEGSLDGDVSPAYSPDGRRIALTRAWNDGETVDVDIFVLDLATGGRTQLFHTPDQNELQPSWSPDGSALTFFRFDPPFEGVDTTGVIETITLDGGTRTPITNNQTNDVEPDWGAVAAEPPFVQDPAWSAVNVDDHASLAYVSDGDIYTVDVGLSGSTANVGSEANRVFDHNQSDTNPARRPSWSPNGSQIVFEASGEGSSLRVLTVGSGSSFEVESSGRQPSWSRSADVNRIAYVEDTEGGPQIYSFVLGDESGSRFETNGTQPAWGTGVSFTFTRPSENGSEIWIRDVAKPSEQRVASGVDSDFATAKIAFVRGGVATPPIEFQSDVFLLSAGGRGDGGLVVRVSDDNAGENRLDILVDCEGLTHVAAVALEPDNVNSGIATWETNYDPSLTCANPTLRVAVSDGYNRVVSGESEAVASEAKKPTAAIYSPSPGSTFDEYDLIPARGSGWDAEDGTIPDGDLQWKLTGPGYSATGTTQIADFSPPENGFPNGVYELMLTVTDSDDQTDTATRSFTIVGDDDNDGLTNEEEALGCLAAAGKFNPEYASASLDPMNAFLDGDLDGIPNVDDGAVCTAASEYEATIQFDPTAIDRGSSGVITARVTIPNRNMRDVSSAYVKSINGVDVSANEDLDARQWLVAKGTNVGQAKIDRAPLNAFFAEHGIANQTVRIVIAGSGGAGSWTFEGVGLLGVR